MKVAITGGDHDVHIYTSKPESFVKKLMIVDYYNIIH